MYIDFKKVRFSCGSLGKIMGLDRDEKLNAREERLLQKLLNKEELTEEERECMNILKYQKRAAEGTLSKTCIRYLIEELFIYHTYGKRIRVGGETATESATRVLKGTLAERSAIQLLAEYDGINYKKNKRKYRNKWVSGIPDINYKKRLGDRKVIDIKTSWDLYTFMDNLPKQASLPNKTQAQGYIALAKADIGEVCHVLVSAPDELIEKQIAKLRYKNAFATIEELEMAIEMTRRSMKFDDIPLDRRVIRFPIPRDEDEHIRIYDRVDLCREWLAKYQMKHENYFNNINFIDKKEDAEQSLSVQHYPSDTHQGQSGRSDIL